MKTQHANSGMSLSYTETLKDVSAVHTWLHSLVMHTFSADASRRRWINWIWTSASAGSAFEEAPTWECQLATFNYGQVRAHSLSIPFLWGWWETDVAFLCDWHFHQTLKETRLSKPRLKKEFVPLLCARAVWESWLGCQTIGFPMISQWFVGTT